MAGVGSVWAVRAGLVCALIVCLLAPTSTDALATGPNAPDSVQVVLTSENLRLRVSAQPAVPLSSTAPSSSAPEIQVDDSTHGQVYRGVGGAMTDTSAWLLRNLNPAAQRTWMDALFSPEGLGLSFVRIPIGASDFTAIGHPYSYDDQRRGRSDRGLRDFSILHDYWNIIPALRQALKLQPALRVMGSLWSAPGWMKGNDALDDENQAGTLRRDMYRSLAQYFVRFVLAYRQAGIPVFGLTPQNEPGQITAYPGGILSEAEEATLIASDIAPALRAAHLSTQIYGWDYNWTNALPPFPEALAAGSSGPDLGGIAWHCYYGDASVMSQFHEQHPGLDQVVSECAQGTHSPFSTSELLIAAFRNWASSVALWNLALNRRGGPVQPPNFGCAGCRGIITVDPYTGQVKPTVDFYDLAQLSHFVRAGATRIQSTTLVSPVDDSLVTPGVDDVAFQNPDGTRVMMAFNSSTSSQAFTVHDGGQYFSYTLAPATTATFIW